MRGHSVAAETLECGVSLRRHRYDDQGVSSAGERRRRRRQEVRRRRSTLIALLVLLMAIAAVGVSQITSGPHVARKRTAVVAPRIARTTVTRSVSRSVMHGTSGILDAKRRAPKSAKPYLGPDGVVSPAILAENRRAGTTAWEISSQPSNGYIQGWADTTDARLGQRVGLYVTTTSPTFHVVAYRMGYYQGRGAREIWRSGTLRGAVQPTCPLTPGINMVSCDNWHRSLTMRITKAFVQGDYLLKLTASGGQQGYILLTVWDPRSTAAYLVVARSLTEQGWNTYGGGYDFYAGQGACTLGQSGSYPPCNRARVVSFDRPYASGDGASDFLGDEYPLVRFMEEHGLDAAYCTDVTLSEDPSIILHHRALLSLGHDETWTTSERQGAENGLAHGVNLALLSAAPLVRHARLQASAIGPDREEVDYRNPSEDPLYGSGHTRTVTGNTFATPPSNWPPTRLVGGEYSGYLFTGSTPAPFVVYDASSWIFKGTGLKDGSSVPGVISSDIEHVNPGTAPAGLEVLGHSPIPLAEAYSNQGAWNGVTYADMTYYSDPQSKAGVFESGAVSWISRLTPCAPGATCPATAVARITGNLLRLFGQGPAGKREPSVANWQHVTPPGS